jgi:hypothetical protein
VTEDVVDDLLLKYQQLQQQLLLQEQEAGQAEGEGSTSGDQSPEGAEGGGGDVPAQQHLQGGQEEVGHARAAAYEIGPEGDTDAAADVSAELNLSDIQLLLSPSGATTAVTADSASLQPASLGGLEHAESSASVTSPVTLGTAYSQGVEDNPSMVPSAAAAAAAAPAAGRTTSGSAATAAAAAAGEVGSKEVGGAVRAVQKSVSAAAASPAADAARRQQALARIKAAMQQDRSR